MDDTPTLTTGEGFYDEAGNYAPNFVSAPGYELLIEEKDTYTYPYHGWVYAPDLATALTLFPKL